MSQRKFIVLGDTTTHGGEVVTATGQGRMYMDGKPVACVGDMVACPRCKGRFPIIEGATGPDVKLDGRKVAREGDKTACGASLVHGGQSRVSHKQESGGAGMAAISMAAAAAGALAAALAAKMAADKPMPVLTKDGESLDARDLFKELANDKNIPFDYPLDCCPARAHEMCRQLKAKQIECGKTWYYSPDWPSASLEVEGLPITAVTPDGTLKWTYHVAPTIVTDNGETMVIDPSLFDRPVTLEKWHARMRNIASDIGSAKIEHSDSAAFFRYPSGEIVEDRDYKHTNERFETHKKKRDKKLKPEKQGEQE